MFMNLCIYIFFSEEHLTDISNLGPMSCDTGFFPCVILALLAL